MKQPLSPDGLTMHLWIRRPDGTLESCEFPWERFIDFLNGELTRLGDSTLLSHALGEPEQDDPQE